MKKVIAAGIMFGGITTFACAQNIGVAVDGPSRVASSGMACAGCAPHAGVDAELPSENGRVVSEPMGGHDIDVFSGYPSDAASATGKDGADPRRRQGRPGELVGPSPGAGGFTLGRQTNLEAMSEADVGDPIHNGTPGRASNLFTQNGKLVDSNVGHFSSDQAGVSGRSSYTFDTPGGDPTADRAWGMSVGADLGILSLRAARQNRHVAQVQLYNPTGATMEAKNSIVAANLRMRWLTAYAAYSANRGWGNSPLYNPDNPYSAGMASTSSTDSRDTIMGVAVPMTGSTTLLASTVRRKDHDLARRDASMVAVGASYVLSRKTDFYAAVSHTVNIGGDGVPVGSMTRGNGSAAVNVGMRHSF